MVKFGNLWHQCYSLPISALNFKKYFQSSHCIWSANKAVSRQERYFRHSQGRGRDGSWISGAIPQSRPTIYWVPEIISTASVEGRSPCPLVSNYASAESFLDLASITHQHLPSTCHFHGGSLAKEKILHIGGKWGYWPTEKWLTPPYWPLAELGWLSKGDFSQESHQHKEMDGKPSDLVAEWEAWDSFWAGLPWVFTTSLPMGGNRMHASTPMHKEAQQEKGRHFYSKLQV